MVGAAVSRALPSKGQSAVGHAPPARVSSLSHCFASSETLCSEGPCCTENSWENIPNKGGPSARSGHRMVAHPAGKQGLALVHFSARPEPFLTLNPSPKRLNSPSIPALNTP
jgi:hypothetical protein